MTKHISPTVFFRLPSGLNVHPCRLIHRDGTLMWKHAVLHENQLNIPHDQATEQHIIKTAQRLEELNSWLSQDLEPYESIRPVAWYVPNDPELSTGINVYFKHTNFDLDYTYENILPHIQEHESLELRNKYIYFKRC